MRDGVRAALTGLGGVFIVTSALFAVLWLVTPLVNRDPTLILPTFLAAFAALGLIYGAIMLGSGLVRREAPSLWPSTALIVVIWLIALAFASAAMLAPRVLADWLFPPMYVLGVALPIAAILSFAVRRTSVIGRRSLLQLVYGGVIATLLAFIIEMMLVIVVIVIGFLIASVSPNWLGLDSLAPALQSNDPSALAEVLRNPIILALAFLGLGVAGPIIEEAAKAGSMILWSGWEPTRNRALVWGLAAGLGFALTEGMLNSLLAIGAESAGITLLVRAGASLMHGMTTAIVGLGWWRSYSTRRPWPALGAYVLAVAIHGLWNVVVLGRAALGPAPTTPGAESGPAVSVITSDLLAATSVALVFIMAFGLARLTSRPQWATSGESAADVS